MIALAIVRAGNNGPPMARKQGKRKLMPSFKPVIALTRGLDILRVVNDEGQSTVRSLHKATGLDKATIVRMLETLEHAGYVMRDSAQAVYAPTGRTLVLSHGYDRHLRVGAIAEPVIGAFHGRVGWPSDVAICDRDAMVVVQTTRRGHEPIFISRKPGFRVPVLTTSVGLSYLAFCGDQERDSIVSLLASLPDAWNELACQPRKLQAMLGQIQEAGYAVMDDDYSERVFGGLVWAMAVPVRHAGQIFASINMMMLKNEVSRADAERKFLGPLQETAAQLAEALVRKGAGRGV